jgi:hypothetical protein
VAGNRAVQSLLARRPAEAAVESTPAATPTEHAAAVASSLALRERMRSGMLVQRVATWGGDFDTRKYSIEKDPGTGLEVGVDIQLEFKPGKNVNSSHIGMVQMVNSIDLGTPVALNATTKGRSIAKGPNQGAHIDQLEDFGNPIYYTDKAKKGDALSSTPSIGDVKGGGRPGWRARDSSGKITTRSARLNDTPQLSARGANASQIFETTAVALEGTQRGTYYGSVEWGWRTDGAGKFSQLPLTKKADDVPTDTFIEATGLWNASKTSAGKNVIKLTGAVARFTNADAVGLFRSSKIAAPFKKLDKNTRVEVTSSRGARSKVTVVSGTASAQVGWVTTTDLSASITK